MTKIGHSFYENNFSARSDAFSAGVSGFVFCNELLSEFRHGVWLGPQDRHLAENDETPRRISSELSLFFLDDLQ